MLLIKPQTKIYFFCAPNFATGGPEALHQLAHHLNKLGCNAYMYYEPDKKKVNPVHPFYEKYNVPFVRKIINENTNILILPETSLDPLFDKKFSEIKKVIWWLSVTNYYLQLNPKIRRTKRKITFWLRKLYNPVTFPTLSTIKDLEIYNIAHSYFSKVHLLENNIKPIGQISDYMNHTYFDMVDVKTAKENIIIYKPKKNSDFLNKIIEVTPQFNWIPLFNLTPTQVAGWMNKAKLYVDFGYHPGKERMPREACIMNCCLIIGKDGSAKYTEDMPIPDKYRFEKEEQKINKIITQINNCLDNYEIEIENFKPYREILLNEETTFIKDIKTVFRFENEYRKP